MTAPTATAPSSASVWEDFVDIFYAPSQVFQRRRAGRFGLALVILCVFSLVCFAVVKPAIQPAIDAQVDKSLAAMRARPGMTDEKMAGAESATRKMADVGGYVSAPFGTALTVFVSALGLWLIGKLFDAKQSYSQAAMVATYANVPRVIGFLVSGVLAFFAPEGSLTSMTSISVSPARFLDASASPLAAAALARVDPFLIWTTVLLAIGLSITGGISRRSAGIVAAILWVLGTLIAVASAARQMA